ncbi:MAG: restriction endonuclease subunit S [Crocinitomicaceae bacterium]|nr:restriction endonuclease subunit S [Crocinitomicaceae bacterium]
MKIKELAVGGLFSDGDWVESKDQDPDGEVRLVQLADIGDGNFINKSSRFMNAETASRLKCTYLKKGDILIARMPDPIGRACLFPFDEDNKFVTVVDIGILRLTDKQDSKYVMYGINSPIIRSQIGSQVTGTTRQRITRKKIGEIDLPLPPLETQKKIASILDAADAYRQKTKALLEKYDELTQSFFLEMFGDPVTNPKGFDIRILKDFYLNEKEGTKCGPFGGALKKDEFVDEGIAVWNMDNISKKGKLLNDIQLWISEDKYYSLESYSVKNDDIIISRAGTVGKMCVVKTSHKKSIISTNLIRLRLNKNTLLPVFFTIAMTYFKERIGRLKTGAEGGFTHMNTGVLNELKFPYPPINLQNQFAERVLQIETQKAQAQQSLEKAEELFNSLLQRAFKGE